MANLNFDIDAMRENVIPPLGDSFTYLLDAADIMPTSAPSDFQYANDLSKIRTDIGTSTDIVSDVINWVITTILKFETAENKNNDFLNQLLGNLFGGNIDYNYLLKNIDPQLWGTFIPSNEKYIKGYYITTDGRVVIVFDQHYKDEEVCDFYGVDWDEKCNRAAALIVASMYSDKNPEELIKDINEHYRNKSGLSIPENDYWEEFGLERSEYYGWMPTYETTYGKSDTREGYTEVLSEHLKDGGTAMIWLDEESYEGKSKEIWTSKDPGYHWVAVVDYRVQDEQEQMAVADYRGVEWYDIDEFDHNIGNMVLVKEKEKEEIQMSKPKMNSDEVL